VVTGCLVEVRDEEWLVESCQSSADGWRITCRGVVRLRPWRDGHLLHGPRPRPRPPM